MEKELLIVLLVISAVILVALLSILIVLIKNRKQKIELPNNNEQLKEIGALSNEIKNVSESISNNMKIILANEMLKVQEKANKNSEENNAKLERFQSSINDSLNKRFDALNDQMVKRLNEINQKVEDKLKEGFKNTSETMTTVQAQLAAIDTAQKNIEKLSGEVVSLKQVLEGNQTRGQYGEYQLSMVLHNVFGDTVGCYEEQYTMRKSKSGEDDVRADAVVFMPEPNKMICIDSKFPFQDYAKLFDTDNEKEKEELLKSFNSAVKKHITAIKDKYIVPDKTAPEALMFIPNDGVFAFIHHNCLDAVEYARNQKVIIVSPSTLPAILVTINMLRIEVERAKNVKEISDQLTKLGKQFSLFGEDWGKLSNQLKTISNTRERLDTRVNRITTKFESISNADISEQDIPKIEENDN